jgi:hypothetical protein
LSKVRSLKVVRLAFPEKLFTFDPGTKVNRDIAGDKIDW